MIKSAFFLTISLLSCALQAELFFTPQMIASHLKGYSEEEIELIKKDLSVVRSVCLDEIKESGDRFYLATAGAPGARKSTILEKFLSHHPEYQSGAYIDPDPRTLRFMVHTYYARSLTPRIIAQTNDYDQVIRNGYEKWRGGSNYIALTLLEEAFAKGFNVVHGTTSTGGHVPDFFAALKARGYKIILLLCHSPSVVRYEAVDYRNSVVRFYQSSPGDAISKETLFAQRMGHYFRHADKIYLYWSDRLFSPETLAGIWEGGKLTVEESGAMKRFIERYELDRENLAKDGITLPSFSSLIEGK